jgi:Ca2+-binding RTX toxin-like protein
MRLERLVAGGAAIVAGWGFAVAGTVTGAATITGGTAGSDEVTCWGRVPTIVGTDGRDKLFGTKGRDVILGLRGADTIDGRGGRDLICGGRAQDVLAGGSGNDVVLGNRDGGYRCGDRVARFFCHRGDILAGGIGRDQLIGGEFPGGDTVTYANSASGVRANLVLNRVSGQGVDSLDGIEYLVATPRNDLLRAGPGYFDIQGGAGSDDLSGGAGADQLYLHGGPDDDRLTGGKLRHRLAGDDGDDVLQLGVTGGSAYGGDGNDILRGDDGGDYLEPGRGDDRILAEGGNDQIFAYYGRDTIQGGSGREVVYAHGDLDAKLGAGRDYVVTDMADGGILEGGPGRDRVFFTDDRSVTVDLASGTFSKHTQDGIVTGSIVSFEWIQTWDGNDTVTGSEAAEQISTNAGRDTVKRVVATTRSTAAAAGTQPTAAKAPTPASTSRQSTAVSRPVRRNTQQAQRWR